MVKEIVMIQIVVVGAGNGDLNGEQRSKIVVEDDIDIIKDLLFDMPLYEINRMNPADETLWTHL